MEGLAEEPRPPLLAAGPIADAASLMDDIAVLKRVRRAGSLESGAERLFRLAWAALADGGDLAAIAMAASAASIAGARMGPLDAASLAAIGVPEAACRDILWRALHESGPAIAERFASGLDWRWTHAEPPAFVEALRAQPRAGATSPGRHRLVLLPPESHADHCLLVAVGGVLLCEHFDADPATVFLAGLAHHLHNARMPDAGFQGEVLLGDELAPLMARLFDAELATLPPALAARARAALACIADAGTPEGRAFHAADVIDRVLQTHYHEAVAAFRAEQALDDMELVHPGPVQAFHYQVLREARLA